MAVHTDWRIDRENGLITQPPHDDQSVIFHIIAEGADMGVAIERATLAAAAPDLLEALEGIAPIIERQVERFIPFDLPSDQVEQVMVSVAYKTAMERVTKIRSAIAKTKVTS